MCESNTTKQKYLLKAHPSPYLFDNMEDLGSGQAYDVRTQCTVDVPKVRGSEIVVFHRLPNKLAFRPTLLRFRFGNPARWT